MKNTLLAIALFFTLFSFAQTDIDTIKKETLTYFKYVENNNSEGVIGYMHPKVFETVSKEELKAGMDQMLKNEQMKIEFLSTDILNVSDVIEHKKSKFCLLEYSNEMKMTFLSEVEKSLEEKQTFINFMKSTMEAQFGEGNVEANAENAALNIHIESTIYTVYNSEFEGWKFLANDPNMKAVIDTIIPETVRTQLIKE
jgi:hypothetical protein